MPFAGSAARPPRRSPTRSLFCWTQQGIAPCCARSRAEKTEDKLENIQELIALAGRFRTARELLDHAAPSTSGPQDENADRVRLMTMHKGKGLEFRHVFLPGWEVGIFTT